ncbi:helix-turn-helix transcriptional regulator, partial [Acutalibacter muris]|uniref:helix-turn-helix transcriptional regulator n=1 Tax=Acutalibacter muris TaxID=1796620 RepID=UPI00272EDE0F
FTGMSFNAYLVNYRLELAAKQLSETGYRVIDVAENCGFHNHSYFTRAFREKYQMTPTEYRKAACMGRE